MTYIFRNLPLLYKYLIITTERASDWYKWSTERYKLPSKGNALYKAIVKICNTGKDIWYETNESKYNDYVIYNTPSGKPEPTGTGTVRGTVTNTDNAPVEGVVCKVLNTEITVETDEFGEYEAENVPVGDQAMEFTHPEYETYLDEVVSVFENQETINDIEMVPLEVPNPPES